MKGPKGAMRNRRFAFTVEVDGVAYDAYHFTKDGKPGTLAFGKIGGTWVIAVLQAGTMNAVEVRAAIESGRKPS